MPDDQNTLAGQQPPQPQVPEGFVEKARFDGLMRKVEELTIKGKAFDADLAAKTSELEQLRVQLGIKDTEKQTSIAERDKKLEELVNKDLTTQKELDALRARALKVDVIKELKQPALLTIIDDIPNMTDREALKTVLTNFADFANNAVKEREQQLLSGMTPVLGGGNPPAPAAPTSDEQWLKYIESLPLGSKEKDKAFSDYFAWGTQNHK